jgi:hypothetical protein
MLGCGSRANPSPESRTAQFAFLCIDFDRARSNHNRKIIALIGAEGLLQRLFSTLLWVSVVQGMVGFRSDFSRKKVLFSGLSFGCERSVRARLVDILRFVYSFRNRIALFQ